MYKKGSFVLCIVTKLIFAYTIITVSKRGRSRFIIFEIPWIVQSNQEVFL